MASLKRTCLNLCNKVLALLDLQIRPLSHNPYARGYISAQETILAAKKANLSVCAYLEKIWDKAGDTQRVIDRMEQLGVFDHVLQHIVEIGTGSGRYLEKVLRKCDAMPRYESYETDPEWAKWLASTYPIHSQPTTGKSLDNTPNSSVDLIHAHGVFVYLPFLTSYQYFLEIFRVVKPQGYVVFDLIAEDCLDETDVMQWLQCGQNYICFLSTAYVIAFFERHGFKFLGEFFNRYGEGKSQYLVFRNDM